MGKINDLKDQALATLKGKWGSFVGLTFIYILLYGLASCLTQFGSIFQGSSFTTITWILTVIGVIVSILFVPMQYGYYIAHLNSSRQDLPADIGDLFCGYRRFTDVFFTLLLQMLVIIGIMIPAFLFIGIMAGLGQMESHSGLFILIAFLLMIPGIVLSFAYAMVPFILHDKPELHPVEVLRESRMMMQDHKMEYFLLLLSFIGWGILCVFTFFIGFLWLAPYIQMTEVKYYEELRAEYEGVGKEEVPTQEDVEMPAEQMQEPEEITE